MAEDILSEINQEIKQERFEKFLLNNWKKFIGIGAFIVALTAAAVIINDLQEKNSLEIGSKYYDAYQNKKPEIYNSIIAESHKGYTPIAALSHAAILNSEGKTTEALKEIDSFLGNSSSYDKALVDKAKLDKALYSIKAKKPKKEVLSLLENLTKNSVFASSAKELKALYLIENGKFAAAEELLKDLAVSENVPASIKERAKKILKTYK